MTGGLEVPDAGSRTFRVLCYRGGDPTNRVEVNRVQMTVVFVQDRL